MNVAYMNVGPSHKRSRPTPQKWGTQDNSLPPLPKISGDIILQVFTHKSLQRSHGGTLEENSDNQRLAVLGNAALEAVVTHALFKHKPTLALSEIRNRKESILSDENFGAWVDGYRLRNKVRCHPGEFSSLSEPEEIRALFYSYVGGVYAESGMEVVGMWVVDLMHHFNEPPMKRIKSEPMSSPKPSLPIFFATQPPPSPQREKLIPRGVAPIITKEMSSFHRPPAPPVNAPAQIPNPLAPAQPNLPFLPLFNQTASQRRCVVEYPAVFSGPSHAGKWTVKCIVNGIPKGEGIGASKQIAKEEAARKAYYAMGWT